MLLLRDFLDCPSILAQRRRNIVEPDGIYAEVGLPNARAGPDLDEAIAEIELDVVNVPLFQRLELHVQVPVRLLDDLEAAAVDVALPRLIGLDGLDQGLERRGVSA